jgi:hypothetical protein
MNRKTSSLVRDRDVTSFRANSRKIYGGLEAIEGCTGPAVGGVVSDESATGKASPLLTAPGYLTLCQSRRITLSQPET